MSAGERSSRRRKRVDIGRLGICIIEELFVWVKVMEEGKIRGGITPPYGWRADGSTSVSIPSRVREVFVTLGFGVFGVRSGARFLATASGSPKMDAELSESVQWIRGGVEIGTGAPCWSRARTVSDNLEMSLRKALTSASIIRLSSV
jgi:hypothetical protein